MSLSTPADAVAQATGHQPAEPACCRVERVRSSGSRSTRVPQPREDRMTSTWRLAKPARIAAALDVSQAQNSGGWFVAGASGDVGRQESVARTIAGREVVFWRDSTGTLVAGPGACPHLGALMDKLPGDGRDDVLPLAWSGPHAARGQHLAPLPRLRRRGADLGRPAHRRRGGDRTAIAAGPAALADAVTAVIAQPGTCEPQDVIANRLDPWHGSWFHPYAFSHLVVDDDASDEPRPWSST